MNLEEGLELQDLLEPKLKKINYISELNLPCKDLLEPQKNHITCNKDQKHYTKT